jgi:hypothetical protein
MVLAALMPVVLSRLRVIAAAGFNHRERIETNTQQGLVPRERGRGRANILQ